MLCFVNWSLTCFVFCSLPSPFLTRVDLISSPIYVLVLEYIAFYDLLLDLHGRKPRSSTVDMEIYVNISSRISQNQSFMSTQSVANLRGT